ncbi:MAG: outer membrane protein assembly factor BamE [Gammaproteobacteria bacterium]|nr:outer membrane protein assembly factor BamE [Gammaproteobacteria bacterium]MDH5591346.1 outer membrane protein assembly factor BamE [Gammaproteobacteria bacterium]
MKTFLIYTFSVLILLISGCSKDKIPGVYRIDIQQGNDVTQEMINKLKPDMTKKQVAYVMGTPLVIDTFHPDRWDYIYSFHPGNGQREQRRITLYFEEDKLSHIEGNTRTVSREDLPQGNNQDSNVVVPLTEKETGLFQSLINAIGLGDDDQEVMPVNKGEAPTESESTPENTMNETEQPEAH